VCAHSPEGQPYPGLHPQQRGQQAREGILPFCPALVRPPRRPASSSGALSTGQSWSCGSGARGGPSNDPRGWNPSAVRKGWESWGCSVCRREGSGQPLEQLPVLEWGLQESWRGTFYKGVWG